MHHFHPLLQDQRAQVFLIHCEAEPGELRAALLVVDGFVSDDWIRITEPSGSDGVAYLVQLPSEVMAQSERYKGYDVVLPSKRIA